MESMEKRDPKSWSWGKPAVGKLGGLGKGENKSSTIPGKSPARFEFLAWTLGRSKSCPFLQHGRDLGFSWNGMLVISVGINPCS